MPRLTLSLLGSFQVTLEGQPVTAFVSDKARALLAYLAVESDRPHSREKLAGLLWPDSTEAAAHASLSQALTNLRHVLREREAQPPVLLISRQAIQFNRESDSFVDAAAFIDLSGLTDLTGLERAASLYRGRFLEGFSLPGSSEFEEWLLLEQEHLHRLATEALARLAETCEVQGQLGRALAFTWRQLELDPWRESAHCQAMRILARSGQRDAALAQYQTCCRLLAEELAAEPSLETVGLYEQIRDGRLPAEPRPAPDAPAAALPGFLTGRAPPAARPVFVAREKELAWLDSFLAAALEGRGQAVFVVGGPGRGKTVLLHEFARRALDAHPDLLVAMGTCNAYSGVGDPYLPFRGVLAMLTGDAEAAWAAATLTADQARHIWDALPDAAPVLARWGSGLVGTLLLGRDLLGRARAVAPFGADWLAALERLADPQTNPPGGLEQSHLFEQYANVLLRLSEQHPLLLFVDDLQWADQASIGLLFHLGRRIERGFILLAGAYRPHELALGRDGKRHPLEPALAEFRTRFGDAWLDLAAADEAQGRLFVDRFLDTEPNALDERFRGALFGRTRGHALFTAELLRAMQQRGDLVQDEAGRWAEGDTLEWEALPGRVGAVIAERIDRLPEELREMLAVASVEGEEFTAQAVALVQGMDELRVLRALDQQLAARHRLVQEQGELRLDGRSLSRYRFSHFLVQQHLYQGLGDAQRRLLHRHVGEALERLYEGRLAEAAVELVRHFAGDPERERRYARLAGEQAAAKYANDEALRYLSRALELTPGNRSRERYEVLLALERVHSVLGQRDAQQQDLAELEMLASGLGTEEQAEVALRKPGYFLAIADYPAASAAAQVAVQRAQAAGSPSTQAWGLYWLGTAYLNLDWYAEAAPQLEAALELARQVGERRIEAQTLRQQGIMKFWLGADADAEVLLRASMVLAHEIGDKATEADSAISLSHTLNNLGRWAEATNVAEASRALFEQAGDRRKVPQALWALGSVAQSQGDWEQAEHYYNDTVVMSGADPVSLYASLQYLADLASARGMLEEARAYCEQIRSIGEELGSHYLIATALFRLGLIAGREGKTSEAYSYLEQANGLHEQLGEAQNLACGWARLGYVLARQGQLDAGWMQMLRALRFSIGGGYPAPIKDAICCIAKTSVHVGQLRRGAELLGLALRLGPKWADLEPWSEPELGLLRAELGVEELEAAMARGAKLDLDPVIAEILSCETPEAYWGIGPDELRGGRGEPWS